MAETTTALAPEKLTSGDVQVCLRARYRAPQWAYFSEVRDATGFNGSRSADGLAMGLWPSGGLAVHGFEIKVSRSDWLRELDSPGKADPIARFCDHWWVVAPKGVVKAGELPKPWGLLTVAPGPAIDAGDRLRVAVQAPTCEAEPLTRAFLAAVLRRASVESVAADELAAARAAGVAEGKRTAEARQRWERDELARIKKAVASFESAAGGVSLSEYTGPSLAAAYRLLNDHRGSRPRQQLEYLAREAARIAEQAQEAAAAFTAFETPEAPHA